jgi:hypothetical protein
MTIIAVAIRNTLELSDPTHHNFFETENERMKIHLLHLDSLFELFGIHKSHNCYVCTNDRDLSSVLDPSQTDVVIWLSNALFLQDPTYHGLRQNPTYTRIANWAQGGKVMIITGIAFGTDMPSGQTNLGQRIARTVNEVLPILANHNWDVGSPDGDGNRRSLVQRPYYPNVRHGQPVPRTNDTPSGMTHLTGRPITVQGADAWYDNQYPDAPIGSKTAVGWAPGIPGQRGCFGYISGHSEDDYPVVLGPQGKGKRGGFFLMEMMCQAEEWLRGPSQNT